MLVKFKIILDINSEVLFTIYHNKIRAVTIFIFHLVVKIWVIFTNVSDFIWDFGKLPFPAHLGKYIIKSGKISTKIREIGKIKIVFGLGMTPM